MEKIDNNKISSWWLLVPTSFLYIITFFIPLITLLVMSFSRFESSVTTVGFYLDNYEKILTDGITLKIFFQTVELSLMITLFCLLLGYPVAMLMRRVGPRARLWILLLVVSPLLTSIIVRNVAWVLILGRSGMINDLLISWGLISKPLPLMYNTFGVVLAVVHVYLSFMVLPLFAALSSINNSLEEAAASLGAKPLSIFLNVTLPLSLPGIMAGCTLVFILSMGVYLTPVIMGGNFVVTLPMLIEDAVRNRYNWPEASAMALLLLIAIGIMIVISSSIQKWVKS
ncbi:MAG: ABC transporter permease [Pseudomonadota bacterium]|jgi:putative spermidine/putrescine transport system permease protein|nr:ABC transporter permease [Pseudomonadota bacterium]|tara:strand:- start:256 stop:1107 length:852 start_codon:yes stop_codon:yes gene_type:complete